MLVAYCLAMPAANSALSSFAGRSGVIVDAFCGVGGNAIQFAFTCEKGASLPYVDPRPQQAASSTAYLVPLCLQ